MEAETLTDEELEQIKTLCEAVLKTGVDWPRAVSLFPAQDEEERLWKEKMLKGIQRVFPQGVKRKADN